ncbi:MAG: DUF1844 domain-containing protein [Planctomycetota bacterium]|nr:DUF1844 domain-containing protein [Planctomycetota bacterium]
MSEQPKIIIDSDWKSQAQAEKQRLEAQEAAKKAQPQREDVRFEDVVGLLATQALSYLGYFPDPQSGQSIVSIEYARVHIDMLGVLEAKTKGNLSEAEQTMLTKTLTELRAEFVEVSKAVEKAVQEGRVRRVPMGGPGRPGPGGPIGPADLPGPGGLST